MSEVDFKEVQEFVQVDKLKIVACDGRGECICICMHVTFVCISECSSIGELSGIVCVQLQR